MRIILLTFLLSFEVSGQNIAMLQKKLDSLKLLQTKLELNLKDIKEQISSTDVKIALIVVNEPLSGFKKMSIINKEELFFFSEKGGWLYRIPPKSEIDLVGYKLRDDYPGAISLDIRVIHKGTIGYVNAFSFNDYMEVNQQINEIISKEYKMQNARKEQQDLELKEKAALEAKEKAEAKKTLVDKFKKLGSPLTINSVYLNFNSIGTPEAVIFVSNISEKTIDGFEVSIICHDNYNRPVNHYLHKTNRFRGLSQMEFDSGTEDVMNYWTLHGFDNTTKITLSILSVHFTDGKIWRPTKPVTIKNF